MAPLSREQFQAALRSGHGRALLHIRQFGADGLKQDILDACLTSYVYDAQCEGTRGEWLYEVSQAAGILDAVIPRAIERMLELSTLDDFWTVAQLYSLAASATKDGTYDARHAIYEKFDRQEFNESWLGGIQLIIVDGLAGFLHAAEVIGKRLIDQPDYCEDGYLISVAYDRLGKEQVADALATATRDNPAIRRYSEELAQIERRESDWKNQRGKRQEKTVAEILHEIESLEGKYPHRLGVWGKHASDNDLRIVFQQLITETRPEQLCWYLNVFRWRGLPELPARILKLADSGDDRLRDVLCRVLGNKKDAAVRAVGLQLLNHTPPRFEGIRIFEKNYQSGDPLLFEKILPADGDRDTLHEIGFAILQVTRGVKDPDLANCLLWLNENGPCSMCRGSAVRHMLEMKVAVPSSLIEECRCDCSNETRELVGQETG